ncbi:MAG: hypothetical protein MI864_25655 [Pseudomonadales bacterium]|nr:hypothetical protein [Pseudomonadales bacterium]
MNTVNKTLGKMLLILAFCGANLAQAGHISLNPFSTDVAIGDTISIDIVLEDPFTGAYAGDSFLGFGFDFDYDQTGLQFTHKTMGSAWDDYSDAFNDTMVVGSDSNFGIDDNGQSEFLLTTLYFEVIGAGDLFLNVFSDSANSANQGLFYIFNDVLDINASTSINVSQVPEPPVVALFALALGIMGARGFRKSAV